MNISPCLKKELVTNTPIMKLPKIKTKAEYYKSLELLEEIFNAKKGTKEEKELHILVKVIEQYENIHYHIEKPDPIEALKFREEQIGKKKK